MKVSYDPQVDAMYISFSSKRRVTRTVKTVELSDDVMFDYSGKTLVGIEILDASEKISKKDLKKVASRLTLTA